MFADLDVKGLMYLYCRYLSNSPGTLSLFSHSSAAAGNVHFGIARVD